jgi:hypothetical protein
MLGKLSIAGAVAARFLQRCLRKSGAPLPSFGGTRPADLGASSSSNVE